MPQQVRHQTTFTPLLARGADSSCHAGDGASITRQGVLRGYSYSPLPGFFETETMKRTKVKRKPIEIGSTHYTSDYSARWYAALPLRFHEHVVVGAAPILVPSTSLPANRPHG